MITVFDTETSGWLTPNYPADHPKQGRILQIAAILLDYDFIERGSFSFYIDVDEKLEIHESAYEAHGITIAKCKMYGVPMEIPLMILDRFFRQSEYTVAHNHQFDSKHIAYEDMAHFGNNAKARLDFKIKLCTMTAARSIPTIVDKRKVGLQDVHFHLFGETPPKDHDALIDCKLTVKILKKLLEDKRINHIIPPVRVLPSPENLVQVNS